MAQFTDKPKWSGRQAVFVMAALFVLALPADLIEAFFLRVFLQSLAMGVLVVMVTRRTGASWADLGLHRQDLGKNALFGFVGGLVLFFAVVYLNALIQYITGQSPESQEVIKHIAAAPSIRHLVWAAVVVIIAGPVAEELYFRGMVYPLLRARLGVDFGIFVSALFFSAVHFDIFGLAPIAIGGAGLAYFYQRTGSLITSIVAHGTWNGLMLIFVYLGRDLFT